MEKTMENQPTEFRERLLGAQPVTPNLREEYRRELEGLQNYRLTALTRWIAIASIAASIFAAVMCVRTLWVYHAKDGVKIVAPAFAVVFLVTAGWLARAVRKGGFNRRASFAMVEYVGGLFAS